MNLCLYGIDADLFYGRAQALKFNLAAYGCKQCIITAAANVFTSMDMGTSLANQNVSCQNKLTVTTFYTQSFGLGITAVLCGTDTFFMSKKNCG